MDHSHLSHQGTSLHPTLYPSFRSMIRSDCLLPSHLTVTPPTLPYFDRKGRYELSGPLRYLWPVLSLPFPFSFTKMSRGKGTVCDPIYVRLVRIARGSYSRVTVVWFCYLPRRSFTSTSRRTVRFDSGFQTTTHTTLTLPKSCRFQGVHVPRTTFDVQSQTLSPSLHQYL